MRNEFERRMMAIAKISKHHNFAYVIKTCEVNLIIYDVAKDLKLPNAYKHYTKGPSRGGGSFTVFRDEDLEEFKQKLEKWLGGQIG